MIINPVNDVSGLFIPRHNNLTFTYHDSGNGEGEIETITYKNGNDEVAVATLTYNSDNKILTYSVVQS